MKSVFVLLVATLCLLLIPFSVAAAAGVVPDIDLVSFITNLLGDKATYVLVTISVIGFIWSQARQFISADALAKLPKWVIWILEVLAANKGKASNSPDNDPAAKKNWAG